MRTIYSAAFYLLLPFVLLRLLWRSIKAPEYRRRLGERLGWYSNKDSNSVVWFHAVSVGEAEALFSLVKRIQQLYPSQPLLITTMTPTGSARVVAALGDTVEHVYLPYDIPFAIQRFFAHFKPRLAVIMETELWPNLFAACAEADVPLYVVNARLSEKSAVRYQKIPWIIGPTLQTITRILTQSRQDAERFKAIGALESQIENTGNIKFDMEIAQGLREEGRQIRSTVLGSRFVWIIASTHKPEEDLFLSLYQQLKPDYPELLLILVPRHPQRFSEVQKLIELHDLKSVTRSSGSVCTSCTDVFLVDRMGELKPFYAASDLAFVGGSMAPVGGHNILEPAALGVPVMFGPFMANFREIEQKVLEAGAAIQCQDAQAIIDNFIKLKNDEPLRRQLINEGLSFVGRNQGALEKIVQHLSDSMARQSH
ncbi:lipid IV(A) 3-deoxy-D-manno-octulosonic acid transferase [Methylicorpusculum oleiharenae]|uniref:lipid IV(A) 3-deoxy-D-manno-octulosonic acid transferase n=1 Tax=Methylicorpusculum oleiharenae TaxID=1338687 RepID=UPI0013569AA7|nr:lipid IV(A) 3-deoxy-D-manno-octulosonic acid transferase [Methylicorpusculum oleiharenae]MCD2450866.1 lipid IV(A) 3-deoxy-D-manno-octulosonic acid transferase [Methylicorpusculum oleiharenae]